MLSEEGYQNLFKQLDAWLFEHKRLWDVQAFHSLELPWLETDPEMCQWLSCHEGIPSSDQVEAALLRFLPSFAPMQWNWGDLTQPDVLVEPSSHFKAGIKGRKWSQIEAFSRSIQPTSEVVEWCAGKGHLGKLIAFQHQCAVHSLEWQASLCEAGQAEASKRQISQRFSHTDVLKGEGKSALCDASSAVALHACGNLHCTLIEQAIEAHIQYLAISPCCYHLTNSSNYRPLSQAALAACTHLSQDNLKLAVKEVVTAGAREQRLKDVELAYRLGFDALQRHVLQQDSYLTVPSCGKALLNDGFAVFVDWASQQKNLSFKLSSEALQEFESIGYQRVMQVQKVESVMQYFRRSLELWLVLDRALRLEEAGYQTLITTFCDKAITPRNILITANLRG